MHKLFLDTPLDATIKRFEFSCELTWKTVKKVLEAEEEIIAKSPKQVLQQAYLLDLIDDEQLWIDMLKARNLTSHTYKQDLALEIYNQIADYYMELRRLVDLIKTKYM